MKSCNQLLELIRSLQRACSVQPVHTASTVATANVFLQGNTHDYNLKGIAPHGLCIILYTTTIYGLHSKHQIQLDWKHDEQTSTYNHFKCTLEKIYSCILSTPLFCACAASDHTALLKCLLLLSLLLLFWETHVNSSQKLSSIHPNRSLLHALRMDMPRSKTTNKILQFSAESRQSALYVYLMAVKWMLLLCSEKIFNSHLSDKSRLAKCWYELTNTHRKQKKTARVIWSCLIFIYKYNAKKTKVSLHRILDISDIYK